MSLDQLSIGEIRQRLLQRTEPVTPRFLNKLRRDRRSGALKIYQLLKRRYERQRTERLRLQSMLNFERVLWKSGVRAIAGVDEAGTGPLAGPVVAAAVVFPAGTELSGIED
ncbi:MAG: ribonuclease HII, partial [Candidatus Binatia bacterium]